MKCIQYLTTHCSTKGECAYNKQYAQKKLQNVYPNDNKLMKDQICAHNSRVTESSLNLIYTR